MHAHTIQAMLVRPSPMLGGLRQGAPGCNSFKGCYITIHVSCMAMDAVGHDAGATACAVSLQNCFLVVHVATK